MDINRWDITVLLASSIAIMSASFVFPAAGLAGESNETVKSDIPDFNVSSDRFDFAGDFPRRPGAPSQTRLYWEERLQGSSDNQMWVSGDTSGGLELLLRNNNSGTTQAQLNVNSWDNDNVTQTTHFFDEEGQFAEQTISTGIGEFTLRFEAETIDFNENQTDGDYTVSITVQEQPTDSNWYERIPVVGTVVSAGNDLVAMVGWVAAIIQWGLVTTFEIILNALGLTVDVLLFFFGLASWFAGTYSDVVAGAPSAWSAAFLTLPGVLFALEWGKIAVVAINVIWIG